MLVRSSVVRRHPRHRRTRLRDFRFEPVEKPPDLRLTFPRRPAQRASRSTCQSIRTEADKSTPIDG
ncbi:hypothetical protein C7S14_0851 [Burkholderia cepacia]|nr:hypothetical protein [Burkholderia cepacia]QOH39558.1 hypothetical protein C7S14_0851 [Burkholderia cepacia]